MTALWDLTPAEEAALDHAYWDARWADDDEPESDDDPDD
jgi:hypothetical protein